MSAKPGNRGMALIGTYLILSLILIYSSAITTRTSNQRLAAELLTNRLQAIDLSQGAMEQLREDLYQFLSTDVYANRYQGDAVAALQWLDQLDDGAVLDPPFTLPQDVLNSIVGAGTSEEAPRTITLPVGSGRAWISGVVSTNPADSLAPRDVTITATSTVGGATMRQQATFRMALGVSGIFRNAYFVNNYGWFTVNSPASLNVSGEVRANGDLDFKGTPLNGYGETSRITVNGDLYAATNPELINPTTGAVAAGTIAGNPTQSSSWGSYQSSKRYNPKARPARRLTSTTQPAIGGTPRILPQGQGWDSDYKEGSRIEQRKLSAQPVQPMPYLGDLRIYKVMATTYNSGAGSTLKYYDGTTQKTVTAVYKGPDGLPGNADDKTPLALIGTATKPIEINGPVVIPGDVIIRGVVKGRGTIYTGRNVHIVGNVTYYDPPAWATLERNATTGQVRQTGVTSSYDPKSNLGTVCSDGRYIAPGGGSC